MDQWKGARRKLVACHVKSECDFIVSACVVVCEWASFSVGGVHWAVSTGRCLIWRCLLIDRVVPLLLFRLLAIAFLIRLSCEAIDLGI